MFMEVLFGKLCCRCKSRGATRAVCIDCIANGATKTRKSNEASCTSCEVCRNKPEPERLQFYHDKCLWSESHQKSYRYESWWEKALSRKIGNNYEVEDDKETTVEGCSDCGGLLVLTKKKDASKTTGTWLTGEHNYVAHAYRYYKRGSKSPQKDRYFCAGEIESSIWRDTSENNLSVSPSSDLKQDQESCSHQWKEILRPPRLPGKPLEECLENILDDRRWSYNNRQHDIAAKLKCDEYYSVEPLYRIVCDESASTQKVIRWCWRCGLKDTQTKYLYDEIHRWVISVYAQFDSTEEFTCSYSQFASVCKEDEGRGPEIAAKLQETGVLSPVRVTQIEAETHSSIREPNMKDVIYWRLIS